MHMMQASNVHYTNHHAAYNPYNQPNMIASQHMLQMQQHQQHQQPQLSHHHHHHHHHHNQMHDDIDDTVM